MRASADPARSWRRELRLIGCIYGLILAVAILERLPPGLSLSAAGAISGRPTKAGEFSLTVTATDADGNTGSRDYFVSIAQAVIIVVSPGSLPEGEVGEAYRQTFHRLGRGRALHLHGGRRGAPGRRRRGGRRPAAGLALSSDGLLSGTPAEPGEFS